jgi:hypothetical protein
MMFGKKLAVHCEKDLPHMKRMMQQAESNNFFMMEEFNGFTDFLYFFRIRKYRTKVSGQSRIQNKFCHFLTYSTSVLNCDLKVLSPKNLPASNEACSRTKQYKMPNYSQTSTEILRWHEGNKSMD